MRRSRRGRRGDEADGAREDRNALVGRVSQADEQRGAVLGEEQRVVARDAADDVDPRVVVRLDAELARGEREVVGEREVLERGEGGVPVEGDAARHDPGGGELGDERALERALGVGSRLDRGAVPRDAAVGEERAQAPLPVGASGGGRRAQRGEERDRGVVGRRGAELVEGGGDRIVHLEGDASLLVEGDGEERSVFGRRELEVEERPRSASHESLRIERRGDVQQRLRDARRHVSNGARAIRGLARGVQHRELGVGALARARDRVERAEDVVGEGDIVRKGCEQVEHRLLAEAVDAIAFRVGSRRGALVDRVEHAQTEVVERRGLVREHGRRRCARGFAG